MNGQAKTRPCEFCSWVYPWHECKVVVMSPEDEAAALAALEGVTAEAPATLVYPDGEPNAHNGWYCATWHWRTPTGWDVFVFNDCAEFDYIERIVSPNGREWHFPFNYKADQALSVMTERLKDWKPTNQAGWPGIEWCPP